MPITPAERRGYDDRLRQTREEYENREAEGLKQRNEELRRVEKRHRDDVKQLGDNYEQRLGETQAHGRETLSERDVRHQQDMEDLRTTSMSQLRRKMEDNATQRRELEEAYHGELDKQTTSNQAQRENLTSRQTDELEHRDQHLEKVFADARKLSQEGIEHNRNSLQTAHEKETSTLRKDRDEAVARKEGDLRTMKKSYEDQVRLLKNSKEEGEARADERYRAVVENSKASQDGELTGQREILQAEVRGAREKFEERLGERSAQIDRNNETFRDSVTNRQETQVRSRDHKIGELEGRLNATAIQARRQSEVEKGNVVRSYEARVADLERQKDEMRQSSRDVGQDKVEVAQRENTKLLNQSTRQHRDEIAQMTSQHRDDRQTLLATHQDELARNTKVADKRVRVIEHETEGQLKTLADHYDDSLEVLKTDYASKVEEQRDTHADDQTRLTVAMTNRFRDLENKSQQRLDLTVENYENKLAVQKETHDKDLKRMEATYEQRLGEVKKGAKFEKDSVEQKYEAKIAVAEERHRDELDKVNRRHEEEIRSAVTRTASSFSRKA